MFMKLNGKLKRSTNILQGKGSVSTVSLYSNEDAIFYGILDAGFRNQILGIFHVLHRFDLDLFFHL